jgi:hypothetical protein
MLVHVLKHDNLGAYMRAICKVHGLAAVHCCYAEGGSDLCQVVVVGVA